MFEFFNRSNFDQLRPVLEIEGAILLELFTDGGDAEIGRHLAQEVRLLRQQHGHDMWFLGKTSPFWGAIPVMQFFWFIYRGFVRLYGSCRKYSAATRTQTRLLTIAKPHPAASIIDLTARRQFELPIGTDNEDLVCGTCGMVALSGWSVSSTGKRLVVDAQLLIRCGTCRTYNVVPAARLAEQRRPALALVGDLWSLGSHRLLCGNVLDIADCRTLMGEQRATMVFSDLPTMSRSMATRPGSVRSIPTLKPWNDIRF
jgi:hypothetical protein